MPLFRNISPLACAFGWAFLPPNYILIKYHLFFDTSEKNQLLKSVLLLRLVRVLGCRQLSTSTLAFPTSWTSYVVNTSPSEADEVRCFRDDMGCFILSGLLRTLFCVLVLEAASYCASLGSQVCSLLMYLLVVGWTHGLMDACKFLAWEPEPWRLLQNIHFWFTSATFSLAKVSLD